MAKRNFKKTRKSIWILCLCVWMVFVVAGCAPTSEKPENNEPASTIIENAGISYLGPEGTYTQEAAELFFLEASAFLAKDSVDEAIAELTSGNADYAVIPQENTIGGTVAGYIDALIKEKEIYVVGEVVLPISQMLMGLEGTSLEEIKVVCSHVQGIAQSEKWRKEYLPDAQVLEMASTAAAAAYVKETGDKTIVAIGARKAADVYGLTILAEDVQIVDTNRTRFYVLSKTMQKAGKTNAAFIVHCKADRIDDIIVKIHDSGLELVTLHDRPTGNELGEYDYLIEVKNEKGIETEQIEKIRSEEVRYLGCFDVLGK